MILVLESSLELHKTRSTRAQAHAQRVWVAMRLSLIGAGMEGIQRGGMELRYEDKMATCEMREGSSGLGGIRTKRGE